jgi:hypothetical protein
MKFCRFVLPHCFLIAVVFVLASCAGSAGKWEKVIPDSSATSIILNDASHGRLKLLYTGCGGMLISYDNEAILTDPYYTGHSLLNVRFNGIKIDTANTFKVLNAARRAGVDPKNIATVLIAHSHYDHLQDLPYLLDNDLLNERVTVVGDTSTYCTISRFMKPEQRFINTASIGPLPKSKAPRWIKASTHMRVMMIEADHAPHIGIGKNFTLMQGSTCENGKLKNFDDPLEKTPAFGWREGHVYSWLIDVLDDYGNIELRMFMQSSSCNAPLGFPPVEVLAEHKVDIAIIGVASAQNVDHYPQALLGNLKPQKVILIHWEDFFRDLYDDEAKTVRLTCFNKFFKGLEQQYECSSIEDLARRGFMMPKPLTLIEVKY